MGDSLRFGGLKLLEHFECFGWRDRVRNVAKVNAAHELFRSHVRQIAPKRLASNLADQVPYCVDNGTGGHVNYTLFGTNPSQLAVTRHAAPKGTKIAFDALKS